MCGIFGWNFKKRSRVEIGKREAMAAVLAVANSLRGDKSWGLYTNSKQGAQIRKQVGDISSVPDISTYGRYPLVMGHTRQPTQGSVTQKNAHPFRVNKIILAHNGVIYNSDALDKKYGRKVSVDSQHLAMHMDEQRDFSDIEGYGAIEWVHADNFERVYLCRLKGGSLTVYGIRNSSGEDVGVAWSSDQEHLRSALGAARLSGSYPYKALDEGHIHYIENGKLYESGTEVPKLMLKEHVFQSNFHGYYGESSYWDDFERGFWVRESAGEWKWIQKTGTAGGYYGKDWAKSPHRETAYTVRLLPDNGIELTEKNDKGEQSLRITRYNPVLDDEDGDESTLRFYKEMAKRGD